MKKYTYKRLPYEQIEKVIVGDAEAMTTLVKLYMLYIKTLSCGNQEIEDNIVAKLIVTILKFRLDYKAE